jgi:hypothetical protein
MMLMVVVIICLFSPVAWNVMFKLTGNSKGTASG